VTVIPLGAFKSDPEKKLARDLSAARTNCDKLAERLKAIDSAVSERRAQAQRLARDGANDTDLDAAEAALRSAQDRRSTLAAALVDVEKQVLDLERAHDDPAEVSEVAGPPECSMATHLPSCRNRKLRLRSSLRQWRSRRRISLPSNI
jgi:multidrug efflux pump subunit AcrA (membrane-fusion protein)